MPPEAPPPEGPPADLKARLRATYDAIAPRYNDWTARRHHHYRLRYLQALARACPKLADRSASPRVVELGCGQGEPFLSELLSGVAGPGATAVANDMSGVQLGLARRNLAAHAGRVEFAEGDMEELDFPAGSVTAVAALYSVLHLPAARQAEMLARAARWLETGGCLLVNVPEQATAHAVMDGWLHEDGWVYFSGLGREATADRLRELGFRIVAENVESDEQESFVWFIAEKM